MKQTLYLAALAFLVVVVPAVGKQKQKTFFIISWYGLALIGLYIFGAYALFTSGIGLG